MGEAVGLQSRGISEQVCEKYKIHFHNGELRFHYFDEGGRVAGVKIRTKDKQFRYEGNTDGRFFGQHLFPTHGK